jgi:putative protein-disulfide isomerase
MNTFLYYIHDPMCSWCWGYRPVWDDLKLNLPNTIQIEYVAGGLAPDSNSPMPVEQQAMVKAHWHTIEKKLGTQFNYDFWEKNTPRRSTYNACRAAIAADNQGYQVAMVGAIQQAYYLRALNPSDNEVLTGLAKELSLDLPHFITDLSSTETEQALMQQIRFARELTQQGFPSLVLEHNGVRHSIAINYQNYSATLADISHILNA